MKECNCIDHKTYYTHAKTLEIIRKYINKTYNRFLQFILTAAFSNNIISQFKKTIHVKNCFQIIDIFIGH